MPGPLLERDPAMAFRLCSTRESCRLPQELRRQHRHPRPATARRARSCFVVSSIVSPSAHARAGSRTRASSSACRAVGVLPLHHTSSHPGSFGPGPSSRDRGSVRVASASSPGGERRRESEDAGRDAREATGSPERSRSVRALTRRRRWARRPRASTSAVRARPVRRPPPRARTARCRPRRARRGGWGSTCSSPGPTS